MARRVRRRMEASPQPKPSGREGVGLPDKYPGGPNRMGLQGARTALLHRNIPSPMVQHRTDAWLPTGAETEEDRAAAPLSYPLFIVLRAAASTTSSALTAGLLCFCWRCAAPRRFHNCMIPNPRQHGGHSSRKTVEVPGSTAPGQCNTLLQWLGLNSPVSTMTFFDFSKHGEDRRSGGRHGQNQKAGYLCRRNGSRSRCALSEGLMACRETSPFV